MKSRCLALLCLLPGLAQAYPIEVDKQLNGAEVSYQTIAIDHNLVALALYNLGESTAHCRAVFRNGPEAPRSRQAQLAPGGESNLTVAFKRSVIRLRITLTCQLAGRD